MSVAKEWRLDASFIIKDGNLGSETIRAEHVVGKNLSDAGTLVGSGKRDMGWHFDNEKDALAAAEKLKAAGFSDVEVTPPAGG